VGWGGGGGASNDAPKKKKAMDSPSTIGLVPRQSLRVKKGGFCDIIDSEGTN